MSGSAAPAFDLTGKVAVVTGGYGVLGGEMASALAAAQAKVVVLGRKQAAAEAMVNALREEGGEAISLVADVLDEAQVRQACAAVLERWQRVDILVNAAGGNVAEARTDKISVFEMPLVAFDEVVRLNLHGSLIPTLVFGAAMSRAKKGSIINVSSMAARQAISGVPGYSVAKAAVENLTQWLAVELARKYGDGIRVNAVAPGFFVTTQNRAVLINEDGSYTERAGKIIERTPMGRFGSGDELTGVIQFLCSDAASFITGVVIPVDGGFSAFSGI